MDDTSTNIGVLIEAEVTACAERLKPRIAEAVYKLLLDEFCGTGVSISAKSSMPVSEAVPDLEGASAPTGRRWYRGPIKGVAVPPGGLSPAVIQTVLRTISPFVEESSVERMPSGEWRCIYCEKLYSSLRGASMHVRRCPKRARTLRLRKDDAGKVVGRTPKPFQRHTDRVKRKRR